MRKRIGGACRFKKGYREAGIKFDILSDGAPSENMSGVEGIDSLASCESWLDAVAIGKTTLLFLGFC